MKNSNYIIFPSDADWENRSIIRYNKNIPFYKSELVFISMNAIIFLGQVIDLISGTEGADVLVRDPVLLMRYGFTSELHVVEHLP